MNVKENPQTRDLLSPKNELEACKESCTPSVPPLPVNSGIEYLAQLGRDNKPTLAEKQDTKKERT